jgi:hypothetical protein
MRTRGRSWGALPAAVCFLVLAAGSASAGFESGIVVVRATAADIPHVSACTDGDRGALVVWQENTGGSAGPLRAAHVLASGEIDDAWPAEGAVVCAVAAGRSALGAVTDDARGAFVWWVDGGILSATHVTAAGTVSVGWPATGRVLGRLSDPPQALADGTGGVYLGWFDIGLTAGQRQRVLAIHLGADGHAAGGWPESPLAFESPLEDRLNVLPAFALGAGGSLWAAWLGLIVDPGTGSASGGYFVSRVRSSGVAWTGWTRGGTEIAPLNGELQYFHVGGMRPVAIADAADGGFLLLTFDDAVALEGPGDAPMSLRRFSSDVSIAPGWSGAGVLVGASFYPGAEVGASPRLVRGTDGRILTGIAGFGVESTEGYTFTRRAPDGLPLSTVGTTSIAQGLKIHFSPAGDLARTWALPTGWHNGLAGRDAAISGAYVASDDATASFDERQSYEFGDWTVWYGDDDIALTDDGAAIFIWSQDTGRHGLQAMRLVPGGTVGVPVPVAGRQLSLRVRFVRGDGVHAVASFSGSPRLALSLYDVSGRRVAGVSSDATLGADVVLPGTRDLAGGFYFMRASDGTRTLNARVIVLP